MPYTIVKDPDDVIDIGWNWKKWLDGETITTSTWAASVDTDPASTLTLSSSSHGTTDTRVRVAGGVDGAHHRVTNHVVSSGGRQRDRSYYLPIRQE